MGRQATGQGFGGGVSGRKFEGAAHPPLSPQRVCVGSRPGSAKRTRKSEHEDDQRKLDKDGREIFLQDCAGGQVGVIFQGAGESFHVFYQEIGARSLA